MILLKVVNFVCIVLILTAYATAVKVSTNATLPLSVDGNKTTFILCENVPKGKSVSWFRNDKKLDKSKEKRYKFFDAEDSSSIIEIINLSIPTDATHFNCTVDDTGESDQIELISEPFVQFESTRSKNLVQGDPLTLKCEVFGNPRPTSVIFRNEKDEVISPETDKRVELKVHENIANASLRISNMDFDDKGDYFCEATNVEGSHKAKITVRVKDKLAALWPFLGICAEVVILCLIIFIYERSRKKNTDAADIEDDAAGKLTNSNENNQVRQRKN